jgi:hypothetical protein
MKGLIAAAVLLFGFAYWQIAGEESRSRFILPNSKLLRCKSSDCFQLWSEKSVEADAVFPKQLVLDMNQGCIYGMTVSWDKSIPVDEVKAAIDERYGKWALGQFVNSAMKLWRVEPEKFAIQLTVADKKDEKMNMAEAGTKQAIYIAAEGKSACSVH